MARSRLYQRPDKRGSVVNRPNWHQEFQQGGEEWAKFRLLVKNYRDIAAALSAFDKAPSNAG